MKPYSKFAINDAVFAEDASARTAARFALTPIRETVSDWLVAETKRGTDSSEVLAAATTVFSNILASIIFMGFEHSEESIQVLVESVGAYAKDVLEVALRSAISEDRESA